MLLDYMFVITVLLTLLMTSTNGANWRYRFYQWLICNLRQICGWTHTKLNAAEAGCLSFFRVLCDIYKCPRFVLMREFMAEALSCYT